MRRDKEAFNYYMKTILARKLFENKDLLNTIEIEAENKLTLDFAHVEDFSLGNLNTLLSLQKIALFNNTKLDIKNTAPNVDKILFETGIYKTLNGFKTNPLLSIKRPSFT